MMVRSTFGALGAVVFAAVVFGGAVAHAAPVTLTFEGLQNLEPVQNYYNGGLGGLGSGPGPNYGVTFGAGAAALIDQADGGTGAFSNAPSGDTVLYYQNTASATLDYSAGFTTGFSTYYSLQTGSSASLSVYSGLDGTGTLLGTTALASTPTPYTVFVPSGVTFAGTGRSIVFSGAANYVVFDNITFGSATPGGAATGTPLPKSATAGLALLGAMATAGLRRRRSAAAAV